MGQLLFSFGGRGQEVALLLHLRREGGGDGCLEAHFATCHRVDEPEAAGVKHEPLAGIGLRAILRIAGDGVTDGFHLCTDLVLAPRFEGEFHEGVAAVGLQDAVVCDGFFAVHGIGAIDLHAAVFGEVVHERIFWGGGRALDDGHVGAARDNRGPVVAHLLLHALVASEHHQAGGAAIEAVEDEEAVAGILFADVGREDGPGGALLRGGIGDGEKAVFLVDDDERVVFPNDAQVGAVKGGAAALVADEDDVAGSERRVEVGRDAPVNPYLSVAKQALDGASAAVSQVGEEEGEERFGSVYDDVLAAWLAVVGLGVAMGAEFAVGIHWSD